MTEFNNCAVIGYGSWATTLIGTLCNNGVRVNWLITNPEVARCVREEGYNPKYVSDLELDTSMLNVENDINRVVDGCDLVLLACPSAFLKKSLEGLEASLDGKFILSAIKGIVPDDDVTVLEYIHNAYGIPFGKMGVISGPSHAEEVSRGKLSYLTVAGADQESNESIARLFSGKNLKVDTTLDIYGLEYASILKNIYAIAAGLATGLGYGDNFLAVLVTACTAEMERFLNESYPFQRSVNVRACLGDLLVTCYSNYSRNRRLGQLIGKGCTVKSAINEMTMVAEGYYAARCINRINAGLGIKMPIADMVFRVLYEGASPRKTMCKIAEML